MKKLLAAVLMSVLMVGCATGTKKEVAEDQKKVGAIHNREEMISKMRTILNNSKNITESQKDQLIDLHGQMVGKVSKINEEIGQLKVVLFKEIAKSKKDYSNKKVSVVTRKIKKLYNKKIDEMFKAFHSTKKILGKNVEHLYEEEWFRAHYRF